jgi:hypothetical protein
MKFKAKIQFDRKCANLVKDTFPTKSSISLSTSHSPSTRQDCRICSKGSISQRATNVKCAKAFHWPFSIKNQNPEFWFYGPVLATEPTFFDQLPGDLT